MGRDILGSRKVGESNVRMGRSFIPGPGYHVGNTGAVDQVERLRRVRASDQHQGVNSPLQQSAHVQRFPFRVVLGERKKQG